MVELLFYLMALLALLTAVGVVVAKSPVASVVSLLGTFFSLSVVYLLAGYQFLAAIQILVYGGAVMVLFLFVVMLLNLGDPDVARSTDEPLFHTGARSTRGLAIASVLGAAGLVAVVIGAGRLPQPVDGFALPEHGRDPLDALAADVFTVHSLPFEATSVLLLAAAVGVMVLAKRQRRDLPCQQTTARGTRPAPSPGAGPRAEREAPEPQEVLS